MRLIPNYCQHPDYWNPGLHLLYVGDRYRLDPYERAIQEIVRSGMVVADIGTGSGPLARFAAAAGAIRVYGIEQYREILQFAERFNETERLDHIIRSVHGDSREVVLEERVDVIVAELISSLGNDEAMSDILEDARKRFLKPGGKIIPSQVDVFISPVDAPEAHAEIPTVYQNDVIVEPDRGFAPFKTYYQILGLPPERLLADEQKLDSIDLMTATKLDYERNFSFVVKDAGTFSGFVGWFKAALSANVDLDTSPRAASTCWGQAFFAIRDQIRIDHGDVIQLNFAAQVPPSSDRPFYRWEGTVRRGEQVLGDFSETTDPEGVAACSERELELR
jgi:protein arginine N-methyltransferase 1